MGDKGKGWGKGGGYGKGGWGKGGKGWGKSGGGGDRPKPQALPDDCVVDEEKMYAGVVSAYYKFNGYGFITPDDKVRSPARRSSSIGRASPPATASPRCSRTRPSRSRSRRWRSTVFRPCRRSS